LNSFTSLAFPPGCTAVIGINEIMPGAEEGEHEHGAEGAGTPAG